MRGAGLLPPTANNSGSLPPLTDPPPATAPPQDRPLLRKFGEVLNAIDGTTVGSPPPPMAAVPGDTRVEALQGEVTALHTQVDRLEQRLARIEQLLEEALKEE